MTCGVSWVDNTLNRLYFKLGIFIGKHPGYFLIVPVLVALLCMTGYQQIKYEIDPEYLFSPISGEGKLERTVVESYFKVNYTHRFNVGRITRPGRFGRVIIVAKDDNDNILRSEVWKELRMLDDIIQNTTVEYDGETFSYRQICARWETECFTNDILNLDLILPDVERGELNLTWPIMLNPISWDAHAFPVFFGGTKVSDDASYIVSVPSLHLVYFVTADTKRQDAKGAAWEDQFLDTVGHYEDTGYFKHIAIARFASRTLDHELEKNTRTVIPFFSSTFVLMVIFSVITCMMGDTVRSKPWLGLLGNVSAVMATAAAFGLAMYLGVAFIGINLAAPFLMIGIGIDDTFVMLAAWRRTSVKLSVPERMGHMLSEAAVSITITSLTDMISFWMGIISPFPSVRIFCTYSALAVAFTYIWHVTFFAGCMAVFGFFEHRNLHGTFGFEVQPVSVAIKEKRSWFYRKFVTGGINRSDPLEMDNPLDNKEHILSAFFRDHVAHFVNKNWVKAFIILTFAAYLGGACYGLTEIKEGLERRKLSKSDSYSVKFFDLEDDFYREFPYRIQVIITGNLNYSDPFTQMQIEETLQQLENTSYVTSSLYTESWLRSFISYVDRNDYLNLTLDSELNFIDSLKELWLYPANPFSLDVKFNDNQTRIEASRFLIQAINITDTNHEKAMVKDLREICKNAPINITIFHPYFVFFDQFELVRPTSIQCMVIGAIIMMIISFIFIPNVLCSIWITFSIISIEVGVVGYMSLWDVNLDSISMINLIMCIGFSIDFTAHICYCYMSSKCKLPKDRVREALYSLGLPIVQGSISTILGVVALLFAESYIFLVFFKMVFLVILFGAMHGLFLLPVMLSLFGPNSCSNLPDEDNVDAIMIQYNKDKKDPQMIHPFSITHPHLMTSSPNGLYGSKQFLTTSAFKGYGNEDKDLGIGTSSEDSSENSSSKSQRRKALEDENVKRRYEEGWRKSSHSIANSISSPSPSQFQPVLDLYGQKYDDIWNSNDNIDQKQAVYRPKTDAHRFHEEELEDVEMRNGGSNIVDNTIARKKRYSNPYDYEMNSNANDSSGSKNLYYYDYNSKRKISNESSNPQQQQQQQTQQQRPRKYITTRRNIV